MIRFYVIRCLECDDAAGSPLDMPFGTARERGQWATAHTKATGHQRWLVVDVPEVTNPSTTAVVPPTL
jgi:hypothetical protein